jgi:hypothetical protein
MSIGDAHALKRNVMVSITRMNCKVLLIVRFTHIFAQFWYLIFL